MIKRTANISERDLELYLTFLRDNDNLKIIKEEFDWSEIKEKLEKTYTINNGRPGIDPMMLFFLTLYKGIYELSDVDVVERLYKDVPLRYLLSLPFMPEKHDIISASTLCRFRTERIKNNKDLEDIVNLCTKITLKYAKEKGVVISGNIIVDSTHTNSIYKAYTIPDVVTNKSKEIRKIMYRNHPECKKLMPVLPTSRDPMEFIIYGKELIKMIDVNYKNMFENLNFGKIFRYFVEIISDCESDFKDAKEGRTFISGDKEATLGHKSEVSSFVGYKTHLAINDQGLTVAAFVSGGHASDERYGVKLLEASGDNGVTVESFTGDGAYSSTNIIKTCNEKGIIISATLPKTVTNEPQIPNGFAYNKDANTLRCPAGFLAHKTEKDSHNKHGEKLNYMRYFFDMKECLQCPFKETCLKKAKEKSVLIRTGCKTIQQKHHDFMQTEVAQEKYKNRYMVEAKNAEFKMHNNYYRAVYIGLSGMTIQCSMVVLITNMKKVNKILEQKTEK